MVIDYSSENICIRKYDEYLVLYDLKNRMIFRFEDVASDIWEFLEEHAPVEFEEICHAIAREYDVEIDEIESDIRDFICELYEEKLVCIDGIYSEGAETPAEEEHAIADLEAEIIDDLNGRNQVYSATIEMTYHCNERCVHCYANYPSDGISTPKLAIENYMRIIDELREMNCMHIAFTGGDPFMYSGFVDVFEYARNKGFVCDIFTNGLYLSENEPEFNRIVALNPRAFYISVYGSTASVHDQVTGVKGSFEKTLQAIRRLKSAGMIVVLNIMALSINCTDIQDIISLAESLDVEYRVSMSLIYRNDGNSSPMDYFIQSKERIKDILNVTKSHLFIMDVPVKEDADADAGSHCSAGLSSLSIAPDGTVYPCISLKIPLGKITNRDLKDIWHGKEREDFLSLFNHMENSDCAKCKYVHHCAHCPGISLMETGNLQSCNTCDRILAECMCEVFS